MTGPGDGEQARIEAAIEEAKWLAGQGFGIVEAYALAAEGCSCPRGASCASAGKHPVGNDWQKRATRSPVEIERRVRQHSGQYGVIPWPGERGLVLDVDHADRLPVALPESYRVVSSVGRGHAYFRLPAGTDPATLPATAPWGEVRVEGAGRLVIGPWSRHASGTVYTPHGEAIAELPGDLIQRLLPPERRIAPQPGQTIRKGDRDATLTSLAGRFRRQGASEAALLAMLHEENKRCVDEAGHRAPLSERELQKIARSVGRYAPEPDAEIASTEPEEQSKRKPLTFLTGTQLAADTPIAWDYLVRPYVALGMIHELDGKPKTAGKTTFLLHLIVAVLDGKPFLGEPTRQTSVVLLTEQTRRSLAPTLRPLGLDRDELLMLTWPDAVGTGWAEIVAAAVAECQRTGARLLVVDTLSPFVGLGAEMENDAAAALAAMRPLQAAAQEHDLAILLTRHDRKSGGDVAESGRGSNAWSGAVDCVMALRRQRNPVRPTIRELEAISRRGDVPEEPVLIELTDAGYIVLGDASAVAYSEARELILGCLSVQQDVPLDGQTLDELAEAIGRPRATVRRAVLGLVDAGELVKAGKGRAGDPFRYALALGSARSVQRSPLRGEPLVEQTREPGPPVDGSDMVGVAQAVFGHMLKPPAMPTDSTAMVPRTDP